MKLERERTTFLQCSIIQFVLHSACPKELTIGETNFTKLGKKTVDARADYDINLVKNIGNSIGS